jgi:hypothetical protein
VRSNAGVDTLLFLLSGSGMGTDNWKTKANSLWVQSASSNPAPINSWRKVLDRAPPPVFGVVVVAVDTDKEEHAWKWLSVARLMGTLDTVVSNATSFVVRSPFREVIIMGSLSPLLLPVTVRCKAQVAEAVIRAVCPLC